MGRFWDVTWSSRVRANFRSMSFDSRGITGRSLNVMVAVHPLRAEEVVTALAPNGEDAIAESL